MQTTKRILSILLTMAMALGLLAVGASAAGEIGMQAEKPTFALGTDNDAPTVVGFGGYEWLAIGQNGNTLTLLAKNEDFGTAKFNSTSPNPYDGGELQASMNNAYNDISNTNEKRLVEARNIDAKGGTVSTVPVTVTNQYFWPLSVTEANGLISDALRLFPYGANPSGEYWWLRSPSSPASGTNAALVRTNGVVDAAGRSISDVIAVRPAFYFNLASVLFTSDASGASAKSSAAVGGGLKSAQAAAGTVKFTMKDDSLTLGSVTATSRSGNVVNFNYSDATPGKTLSAVVLGSGGAVKYYGKLVASTSASGTASVILPGDFATTDTVQIFVEEANGDNYTDFASAYKQLVLAAPGITGPTSLTLTAGYAATSTGTYTVTGSPAPTVTVSGNASISWDSANKKLDIAAGLDAGSYPVMLTASNGTAPDATLTFTLTVHAHSFGTAWVTDAASHWYACACGEKSALAAHIASDWIVDTPATTSAAGSQHKQCTVCEYVMETQAIPVLPHVHSFGTAWVTDAASHWYVCACGEKSALAAHIVSNWIVDTPATTSAAGSQHKQCTVCGYVMETQAIAKLPKGIFGTNAKWYGEWWHYLLFFLCFGFIWMWF